MKAYRLRKLTLDRVDLVDRGANPGAVIRLMKRAPGDAPSKEESMSDKPTVESLTTKLAEVEKALQTATDENAALKAAAAKQPDPEEIEKGLPEPVQKELATLRKQAAEDRERVAKLEEERERNAAIRKAADLKPLGSADDLGGVLYDLKKQLQPATYAAVIAKLEAWARQLDAAKLFGEIGAAAVDADSPEGKIEGIAKRIKEKEPTLSDEQAYTKALATPEGRKLYAAMQKGAR